MGKERLRKKIWFEEKFVQQKYLGGKMGFVKTKRREERKKKKGDEREKGCGEEKGI